MTINTNTDSQRSESKRRCEGWGAPGRWLRAAIASDFLRAWGAERERSSSTHAMQLQNGKLCI
eukprot:6212996-Pleurochrysis_carterae.AAC.1